MDLFFATTNPHKAQELQSLLAPANVTVRAASEVATALPDPVEDADSFEGNAQLKAVAYARAIGKPCLADDSGVEVSALGGAPGVRSARYAGVGNTRAERDHANRRKLLETLALIERNSRSAVDRSARLVCALCLADAHGRVLFTARGMVAVTIAPSPRGAGGFGYDSILLLPERNQTLAELDPEQWNTMSHRANAVRSLIAYLSGETTVA